MFQAGFLSVTEEQLSHIILQENYWLRKRQRRHALKQRTKLSTVIQVLAWFKKQTNKPHIFRGLQVLLVVNRIKCRVLRTRYYECSGLLSGDKKKESCNQAHPCLSVEWVQGHSKMVWSVPYTKAVQQVCFLSCPPTVVTLETKKFVQNFMTSLH